VTDVWDEHWPARSVDSRGAEIGAKFLFKVSRDIFSPQELEILDRCGRRFEDVTHGSEVPRSDEEQRLLAVGKGNAEPQTPSERAWWKYCRRLEWERDQKENRSVVVSTAASDGCVLVHVEHPSLAVPPRPSGSPFSKARQKDMKRSRSRSASAGAQQPLTPSRGETPALRKVRPRLLVSCPECHCSVRADRVARHLEKVHRKGTRVQSTVRPNVGYRASSPAANQGNRGGIRSRPAPPPTSWKKVDVAPFLSDPVKGSSSMSDPDYDQRDASKDVGHSFRDNGRFGSYPSHDSFDDESGPE
jgi:uncharacterized protein YifE (UPF0438 family)